MMMARVARFLAAGIGVSSVCRNIPAAETTVRGFRVLGEVPLHVLAQAAAPQLARLRQQRGEVVPHRFIRSAPSPPDGPLCPSPFRRAGHWPFMPSTSYSVMDGLPGP